ncbi:MAG: hypothetical protein ACRDKZ_12215, partial [Actinomycetota bacterium]
RHALIASITTVAVSAGVFLLFGHGGPIEVACSNERVTAAAERQLARATRQTSVHDNSLEAGRDGSCDLVLPADDGASVRHIARAPGVGTAYVTDEAGSDKLVMVTEEGTLELSGAGEITNPSFSPDGKVAWAEDHRVLKVYEPETQKVTEIEPPERASAIFSPVFTDEDSLTSVVQEPVPGVPGEDEGLNNLFAIDLGTQSWSEVTTFTVGGDDWNALRTPVVKPDGSVLFVRVHGSAFATKAPAFELWTAGANGAEKLSDLPAETYLAGWGEGAPLWNAPSEECADYGLFQETAAGLEAIGCGAVLADPLNATDPDLLVDEHALEGDVALEADVALAVVIGDFGARADAEEVLERLAAAQGQMVASHQDAPEAIRPGGWAVVRPVAANTDPTAALDAARAELPDLAEQMWISPYKDPAKS